MDIVSSLSAIKMFNINTSLEDKDKTMSLRGRADAVSLKTSDITIYLILPITAVKKITSCRTHL